MVLTSIFESRVLDQIELRLNSNEVKSNAAFVYIANLANCKQNIPLFWKCLSTKEKIQAEQYYASDLSDRYIISHGILRYILSYYTHQLPQDIEFNHNEYGKPFLKNNDVQFNMSHSHNMVSYIISLDYRVGIDIEFYDSTIDVHGLADLVFTPKEHEFVITLESKKKLEFFYNLWTTKESLIKASGQGLSYPINTIEAMTLSPGEKIVLGYEDNKCKQEWYYFPLELAEGYSGAIAIEHKINQIIYLEMNNQKNVFNNVRLKCFNSLLNSCSTKDL